MADDLQALLNRITENELRKANEAREELLAKAREDAADILKKAQQQADELLADAQKEADMSTRKGKEALQQAARDVMLSLRSELERRVQSTVTDLMNTTCSGKELGTVIAQMLQGFVKMNGDVDDLTILLKPSELSVVEQSVKAALAKDFKEKYTFAPTPEVAGGFKLVIQSSGVVYDFTDAALSEAISAHVGPKIAAMLP